MEQSLCQGSQVSPYILRKIWVINSFWATMVISSESVWKKFHEFTLNLCQLPQKLYLVWFWDCLLLISSNSLYFDSQIRSGEECKRTYSLQSCCFFSEFDREQTSHWFHAWKSASNHERYPNFTSCSPCRPPPQTTLRNSLIQQSKPRQSRPLLRQTKIRLKIRDIISPNKNNLHRRITSNIQIQYS